MKVGFYGNANNYPMLLARAVRRLGHEVLFLVDRPGLALNRPETRWRDMSPLPAWVVDLGAYDPWQYPTSDAEERALRLLDTCDAVVLNERAMCLAPRLSRPWAAFVTGVDVLRYADERFVAEAIWPEFRMGSWRRWLSARRIIGFLTLERFYRDRVERQRAALRDATLVHAFAPGLVPELDQLLAEIGVRNDRRVWFVMADTEYLAYSPPPLNAVPRVFCVARLVWTSESRRTSSRLDMKGTDLLLEGVALLGRPLELRLPLKGPDVEATRALVARLGLHDSVVWVEEMSQARVFDEYLAADVVVDSLSDGMIGMGAFDALACGRPVIGNARPDALVPLGLHWSGVCQAASAAEVAARLGALLAGPEALLEASRSARAFAEATLDPSRAAARLLQAFGADATA